MTEQKTWSVKDIREEIGRRLRRPISILDYQHWQKLGLAPHAPGKSDNAPVWATEEVEQIIRTITQATEPSLPRKKTPYRRLGTWRPGEFRSELIRRLGWQISEQSFRHLRRKGLIPRPEARVPAINGGWLKQRSYSDRQLEDTVRCLRDIGQDIIESKADPSLG